jgi:short subunit dehydrogenase-like uncharacterized protein
VSTRDPRIVLLGATGYTARLIARRLDASGIPFTLAARDEARAQALRAELKTRPPVVTLDVLDVGQVARVADRADVVVNCVGPYNLFGQVVLQECRTRELVYIDLAGEQEFIRRSLEEHASTATRATILHSIAFESTLADLLAGDTLCPHTSYRSISSFYSFASSRPSPGTHLTMRLAAQFPSYRLTSGVLTRAAPLSFEEPIDFEAPDGMTAALFMPYPEVVLFGHRYRTADAGSFLLMSDAEALFARATRGRPAPPVDAVLEQHGRQRRAGPGGRERRQQRFTLTVHAVAADGERRTRRLVGSDMYEITALLVLQVVEAVWAGSALPEGVLTPSQIPVWNGIWSRLEADGLVTSLAEVG